MKNLKNRILTATANMALKAVKMSAGLPSFGGAYQPKEPTNLEKVIKSHNG